MLIIAENFRGFRRINLRLDKTIFLVGDNSSGKTSIIHLIDFICRSDLYGPPRLNESFHIDSSDFFSPYFDYADVIVGFQVEGDRSPITRVVTLRKVSEISAATAVRITHATENFICVIQGRGSKKEYIYKRGSGFTLEDIVEFHKAADGEFKIIEDVPSDISVNEQPVVFSAISEIGMTEVPHEIIFASAPHCRHFGPLRARPERFYRFDRRIKATGSHFATIMQDVATGQFKAKSTTSVRRFGKQSGLFDDLKVRRITEKIENAPIVVVVRRNGQDFLINQVGIGVSQVAPLIAEIQAVSHGLMKSNLFLVEQPELHLHPVAQAALGEYIWNASGSGIQFIIETHSDFLIDRYRSKIRDKSGRNQAKIIYCRTGKDGNQYDEIEIDNRGRLINPPYEYSEFFIREYTRTMF